jgi:Raf kinase inhibitor-like YbhB/YbcL family protein
MRCAIVSLGLFLAVTVPALSIAGREAGKPGMFAVLSPAFANNDNIPVKYTCDASDINPPLVIENVPDGTRSLALIVDDPDAPVGIWVHWIIWNIGPKTKEIRENSAPANAEEGRNDWRRNRYNGPCPPSGTHRYFFRLYALNSRLSLGRNATKADLEKAMKGRIIAEAELVGLYKRK